MSWSAESNEKRRLRSSYTSVQSDKESSFSLERHWDSRRPRFRSVYLATQRSVCVVVQLATRRKVRVEVQRNTDGDNLSICVLRMLIWELAEDMLFYSNWTVDVFLYYELHRDQGWSLSTVKNIFNPPPPVVYATESSKWWSQCCP